ncbi:dienelactone hydrolase family protein [soil metagenome]
MRRVLSNAASACALAAFSLSLPLVTQAQTGTATYRSESHLLQTVTPTRDQLYAGTGLSNPAVTIAGTLSLPVTSADRVPAVLLLHGDAGQLGNQTVWTERLNALGIAVFNLDSFSARGDVATGPAIASMPESIGGAYRIVDAERALALLAAHPRIDPSRIAVMGFSSGARTVILASQTRFANAYGTPTLQFSAFIALYPPCNVQLLDEARTQPGPLRIFIGEADLVTTAQSCVRFVARLRAAGVDASVQTFPEAAHGFDNSNPQMTRLPGFPSAGNCNLQETRPGTVVNADTGRPLADGDACLSKGLLAGRNDAADTATAAAVRALLIERFELAP